MYTDGDDAIEIKECWVDRCRKKNGTDHRDKLCAHLGDQTHVQYACDKTYNENLTLAKMMPIAVHKGAVPCDAAFINAH